MIQVTLLLDESVLDHTVAGRKVSAMIKPDGYRVEAWCHGWGKDTKEGSIRLDIFATVKSPRGTFPPDPPGGAR